MSLLCMLGLDNKKSMKPMKDFKRSTAQSLHKQASATLGTEDLESCVKLPPNEDKNEWMAVHVVDFYLWFMDSSKSTVRAYLVPSWLPEKRMFDHYENANNTSFTYLWRDDNDEKMEPIQLSAKDYISKSMDWIRSLLDDEKYFPTSTEVAFPKKFEKTVKAIFKKIFRVYAHIFYDHFKTVQALGIEAHINSSFKHFLLFAFEFGLIPKNELEPLNEHIVNRLGSNYTKFLNIGQEKVKKKK